MSLGLGDFDKDILHNQKPSIKKFPIKFSSRVGKSRISFL